MMHSKSKCANSNVQAQIQTPEVGGRYPNTRDLGVDGNEKDDVLGKVPLVGLIHGRHSSAKNTWLALIGCRLIIHQMECASGREPLHSDLCQGKS